jgi:hypothetical protein
MRSIRGVATAKKPKRLEGEVVSFLRPIFRLAHLSFPAVELFVSHFGDDSAQATARLWPAENLSSGAEAFV